MNPPASPGTRVQRVRAEAPDVLEALLCAAGDHLEPVLDVGTTAGGDLLLVLPAPAARLSDLLGSPASLSLGQAVTVLVPLAQCLQRLHDAGVAHGAAAPESVVVDADGCPAWSLTAPPVLLRRSGATAFSAAVQQDRERFGAFAGAVVARAGGRLPEPAAPLDRLVDAVFDLADPEPLRLRSVAPLPEPGPPARLLLPVPAGGEDGARRAVRSRAAAVLAPLQSVRRRVWVITGGVAAALVAALVLLPSGGTAGAADAIPAAKPAAPARPAATRATAAAPIAPRDLPGAAALPLLVAARAACLQRGDAACLDRVVAAGSPARAADRRALVAGADPVRVPAGRPHVLSDGGGTLLADIGGTVVVVVREPDGWRLRDVVAEPPR